MNMTSSGPVVLIATTLFLGVGGYSSGGSKPSVTEDKAVVSAPDSGGTAIDTKRIPVFASVDIWNERKRRYDADMAEWNRKRADEERKAKADHTYHPVVFVRPQGLPPSPEIHPEAEVRARAARLAVPAKGAKDRPISAAPVPGDVRAVRSASGPNELPVHFARTGTYKVWFKVYQTENRYLDLEFLLRAPNTEVVRYAWIDRIPVKDKARPYEPMDPVRCAGWVWRNIELDVEYPGDYSLSLRHLPPSGLRRPAGPDAAEAVFGLAELWVSNDPAFDPAARPVETICADACAVPAGFLPARRVPPHGDLNSSVKPLLQRAHTGYHQCYPYYMDPVNLINLGATSDAQDTEAAMKYGLAIQTDAGGGDVRTLAWQVTGTVGRVRFSDGTFGREFSDSYAPFLELCRTGALARVKTELAQPYADNITMWWTAWEQCGTYDYGPDSVAAFRAWLRKTYGSIGGLNAAWHESYTNFEEVVPALQKDVIGKDKIVDPFKRAQATANFIDFRDFCSKAYAQRVAFKTKAALALDPGHRRITSNLSCNNLSSVMWLKWRPLSFEDTCQITMDGSDMVGYDNYGTDDLTGANYDLYDALGDGKLLPEVREGSVHAADADVAARMQWTMFAKGMRGMNSFCIQESGAGELQKFGLENMLDDAAPRPKLAAFADNYRALHHLESITSVARRIRVDKPVAIYYSSVCNVLQDRPYASIFDPGPDNFFRVYQLVRANGYPCTFITDRQIRETDRLDRVAAVFFIDASYIPTDVVAKVQAWVEKGGHIVCDAQVGAFDGHGFPSDRMIQFCGVEPVQKKRADETAAEKLAFGYSAYSFDVINKDELYQTACEYKNQVDSTHPITKKVGKMMISAFGSQSVRCVAGEVLISENNGGPAWIIREHGKGTSSYFAGYLGTMYGSGCTQYEWRDGHADDAPFRFFDAYLGYIGVQKEAVCDLEGAISRQIRFESPLVDGKGNALLGMVSYAGFTVPPHRVRYSLPQTAKRPQKMFAVLNGSRELHELAWSYDPKAHAVTFQMPSYRVHGTVISAVDLDPLLSVALVHPQRDAYGLADLRPGGELVCRVTVHNLSGRRLDPGRVTLRLPDGWFYDRETAPVPALDSFTASEALTFRIRAPSVNMSRRLRPINFIFENMQHVSTPAVEMVWFQKAPQTSSVSDLGASVP